jgi:transcriptional regulator with GAF, ATPase, and Fis domain
MTVSNPGPETSCPALIYFIDAPPELPARVRVLSAEGAARVLAVAGPGAASTSSLAWELLDAGASDVISWDSCEDPIQAIIARLERWREVDELIASEAVRGNLVGTGPRWTGLLRQIVEVARFTRASVLITGESGTGKELVARLIHQLDGRSGKKELTVLDCATVVPSLSGSEFFGHEKGAFTGAAGPRDGAFALANGGTLFLDEVGELPPNLQAELLRVIQEGMYKRIGSNTWRTTDFRLVSATNRDLIQDQKTGRFRLDLYYRIAAWQFRLPSLDERREDIEPLARYFLSRFTANGAAPEFEPAVRAFLLTREYPGNVRDLRQLVERMSHRHVGNGPFTVGDVPDDDRPAGVTGDGPRPVGPRPVGLGPVGLGPVGLGPVGLGPVGLGPVGLGPVGPGPWHAGAFDESVRAAVARGVSLKEITCVAAEKAVTAALAGSNGSVAMAAKSLGVTARAIQMRRAAGRLTVPPQPGTAGERSGPDPAVPSQLRAAGPDRDQTSPSPPGGGPRIEDVVTPR